MQRWMPQTFRTYCQRALFGAFSVLMLSGCVPTFQGLRPITKKELMPKKRSRNKAEILFLQDYRKHRYAQVGESRGGTTFWRVYKRIRVNNRKALTAATQTLGGGTLNKLEVRTACPDGRVSRMDLDDVQQVTKSTTSSSVWSFTRKSYKFTAPGVSVGCIVDFFWEMELSGQRNPKWRILQRYPVKKAKYTFEYGSGAVYRARLANMESVWIRLAKRIKGADSIPKKLNVKEQERRVRLRHDQENRMISLELTDIPPAFSPRGFKKQVVSRLLPRKFYLPAMAVVDVIRIDSIFSVDMYLAWSNVDRALTGRSYKQDENEELKEKDSLAEIAKKITAKSAGRNGKLWALYNHLRQRMTLSNTRSARIGSRNKLRRVYDLAIGTSYEINMLYILMLRSLGIRAYPAMLSKYNRTYQNEAPAYTWNWVATYIAPKKEGNWAGLKQERQNAKKFLQEKGKNYEGGRIVKVGVVVDPSQKTLPFGVLPPKYSKTWAFVLDSMGGRFFETKELTAKQNTQMVKLDINVAADGKLSGTANFSFTGQKAFSRRSRLQSMARHTWLKRGYGATIKRACGVHSELSLSKQPNLDLVKLRNPFAYAYTFKTPSCVPTSKRYILLRPVPTWLFSLPSLRKKHRLAAIDFGTPRHHVYEVHYTFPKGYKLKTSLKSGTLTGPSLQGAFKSTPTANGLRIKVSFTIEKRMLPANMYSKVKDFYAKLGKLTSQKTFLMKSNATASLPPSGTKVASNFNATSR